jgi:phosphohistidine phosphatase
MAPTPREEMRAVMSELYILRHAKAVPHSDSRPDRDRALEDRGRGDARALAQWIAAHELRPDLVLCSPARRTRETLEELLGAFPRPAEIRYDDELYLGDADRLLDHLRELPEGARRVLLVGHNPGLHELAQMLSDATSGRLADRLADNLPTSGLAQFEVATGWAGLRRRGARLKALVGPRDLGRRD